MKSQRPLGTAYRCLRELPLENAHRLRPRRFITTSRSLNEAVTVTTLPSEQAPPAAILLDPNTVGTRREERQLMKRQKVNPIGSRRRRLAIQSSDGVPFEQMPYQCFQEARKVLAIDREEKLAQIKKMRERIAKWQSIPAEHQGGDFSKRTKLREMQKHLEHLKILADINDPVVKMRFEDGKGDMSKPIYRHLADQKWRAYPRKVLMQRIEQYHIVPDLLHHIDPTASVSLAFGRRNVQPGEFVDSRVSEVPARLGIQVFDKGERLVTIAVVDPDVPDLESDSFKSRSHFLAINVPISPTNPSLPFTHLKKDEHIVQPWLPPSAQKGTPYHRLVIFVLQQNGSDKLDIEHVRQSQLEREGWHVKQLMSRFQSLSPIGVNMFRTQWDEGTDGVMQRAGMEGANVEFIGNKPEKNVYKKKDGSRYR